MRIAVFAFAVLLVKGSTVAAQEPSRDSAAAADDSLRRAAFWLPPIVVTATMAPARQDRIGFSSSVLDSEDLSQQPAAPASRVLRRLPDVFIDEGAGPGGPAVIRVRGGEEPFTKVLWDGVPINISGGFLDIQGLTLSNVERVEAARGPHSALHGSSAMSGVIQFITRRGTVGRPSLDATWEGGTGTQYGQTGRGEMAVRGGVPGFLYSAGGAMAYDRGIYTIAHNAWTKEGSLRLDAAPSSRLSFVATNRYSDIRTNLPVRDPGATRVPLDPNQRDSRKRLTSSLTGVLHATPSWSHRVSVGHLRDDFYYGDQTDGVMQPAGFFVADFTLRDHATARRTTVDWLATNQLHTSGGPAFLSYGASLESESTGDRLTGDFGNSSIHLKRTSTAGVAELHTPLGDRVSLLAGTRVEKVTDLPLQLTPRASLVLSLVPRVFLLRAAAGRSYKVPNVQQQYLDNPFNIPNPDLAPETAFSWEIGATLTPATAPVRTSVTWFRESYHNLIRTVPSSDPSRSTNRNLGRSRAEGLEMELSWEPSRHFSVGANATWLNTEVQENSGLAPDQYPLGEELPFRPRVLASVHALVSAGRFSGYLQSSITGRQTVLTERFSGQRVRVSGYAPVGATLSWQASRLLSFYFNADNLFNQKYETAFDRPGIPLRLSAGFRLTT